MGCITTGIGLLGRLVFWLGFLYIVGYAAYTAWVGGQYIFAVLAIAFAPLTFIITPFLNGLWPVMLVAWGGYIVSTFIGGLAPVE